MSEDLGSLNNKIFVQGNTVGLASYHFETGSPYISYASAPPTWKMDDGSSPPSKKYFEDWSYDAETRTFTGDITWSPVAFAGRNRWEYKMVIDEEFTQIESGTVDVYEPSGVESQHKFGVHLNYSFHSTIGDNIDE